MKPFFFFFSSPSWFAGKHHTAKILCSNADIEELSETRSPKFGAPMPSFSWKTFFKDFFKAYFKAQEVMFNCSVLIHVHLEILILIMGPSLRQKKEYLCHPSTVGLFQQLPKYSYYRDNGYKEQKSKE